MNKCQDDRMIFNIRAMSVQFGFRFQHQNKNKSKLAKYTKIDTIRGHKEFQQLFQVIPETIIPVIYRKHLKNRLSLWSYTSHYHSIRLIASTHVQHLFDEIDTNLSTIKWWPGEMTRAFFFCFVIYYFAVEIK